MMRTDDACPLRTKYGEGSHFTNGLLAGTKQIYINLFSMY